MCQLGIKNWFLYYYLCESTLVHDLNFLMISLSKKSHHVRRLFSLQLLHKFFNFSSILLKSNQDFLLFQEQPFRFSENKRGYDNRPSHFPELIFFGLISLYIEFLVRNVLLRKKLFRIVAICSHWPGVQYKCCVRHP